jgi:hypothetical protein
VKVVELVDQALGMDPAQGLERELSGVVGHGVGQQPLDRPPQRAFGGDADRVGIDLQVGDAEPPEMIPPRRLIGKVPVGMAGQGFDDRAGQSALAHVGLGIDHVIGVAGPQHFQEVQPALRGGEVIVANLCAVAVLVPGAGVIDADPGRRFQPGPQHGLLDEGAGVRVEPTWRLEITMPIARSWPTRRGMVTWP